MRELFKNNPEFGDAYTALMKGTKIKYEAWNKIYKYKGKEKPLKLLLKDLI